MIGGAIIGSLMGAGAGLSTAGIVGAGMAGLAVGGMANKAAKANKQAAPQLADVKSAKQLDQSSSSFTAAPNIGNKSSSIDDKGDITIGDEDDGKKKKRGVRQLMIDKPKAQGQAPDGGADNAASVSTKKASTGLVV